ncbi:Cac2p NDAI_0E00410 [Naumovozyma dairenensis CBS 421]|uniref:CAF1B/HIR1 beta-propeller domain-containing protein n=1 Tax=Naumovozyma dairenensis (strain ATCC 10597 / BCRC 20456 / CBS 421 / NBRC 0211 / NRRL Y-12639) TaxID=1071378 RepID=G0WAT7_NAUDC|nr:hypothetical protein NDAI_0E00410 [Naumovozyma dairenensis CBS 421]CCD24857.1 hypothetical protein NDAI_0E00410 [Naumovozyma dairenensis CBS 421]
MEAANLQIYWHESQPVYSLCFEPPSLYSSSSSSSSSSATNAIDQKKLGMRLITAGGDNKIRSWSLNMSDSDLNFDSEPKTQVQKINSIDFLSSLTQHEQAINVVKFNPLGNILASAGDDGQVLLWKRHINDDVDVNDDDNNKDGTERTHIKKPFGMSNDNDDDDNLEGVKDDNNNSWFIWKRLRPNGSNTSEIYDLDWSPCGNYIVIGSMDNCIRIFQITKNKNDESSFLNNQIFSFNDHNHYVQGVVWDPMNQYILSQSADRSVNIYQLIWNHESQLISIKFKNKIIKGDLPQSIATTTTGTRQNTLDYNNLKTSYLFHNESLPSFFRRLTISPCGSLFCIPTGIFKQPIVSKDDSTSSNNSNSDPNNCVYFYTRASIISNSNRPIFTIPSLKKPALVIAFNPNFYPLSSSKDDENHHSHPYIKLPYKLIYAIATSNEILIYDTESIEPISIIGNLHYTALTDLSWSSDGTMLMISSTDGFCSYISIDAEKYFGNPFSNDEKFKIINLNRLKYEKTQTNSTTTNNNNDNSTGPSIMASTKNTVTPSNKMDIINILPVKRKNKSNDNSSTIEKKEDKSGIIIESLPLDKKMKPDEN